MLLTLGLCFFAHRLHFGGELVDLLVPIRDVGFHLVEVVVFKAHDELLCIGKRTL